MAGHRKSRGKPVALTARRDARRDRLARETEQAPTARRRLELAWDYFRAALSSTDRNHAAEAADACDRAAQVVTALADRLYDQATRDRRRLR